MGQQPQQVAGGNGLGLGAGFQGRRDTAAHGAQQRSQGRKGVLAIFVDWLVGAWQPGFTRVLARYAPAGTTGRHRLEFRQHAGGDQQLIGLTVKVVGVAEHVLFKELEHDQLDANFHAQAAPRT